ncbi:MAG: hypothetical protein D6798_12125 [Deltaproteobacteria bacterium]|nr:MAG: hypothetical protein D6798_12125 [Deltaproteobacteria bacterium]
MLRASLSSGHFPGGANSEGWGRLFVNAQVARWLRGEAPVGFADLLAWPTGMSFWPTDPLTQLVQLAATAIVGDLAGLTVTTLAWLSLAGVGPYLLARTAGASRGGAFLAGLVVQLSPFLARHASDLVLEVLALGPLALAVAAILRHVTGPRPRPGLVFGAILGVALTSPYYAVYLALCCAVAAALRPSAWRRFVGLALTGALACGLALAPLLATESGDQGRLGGAFSRRGFEMAPTALVAGDGRPVRRDRHPARADQPAPPARPDRRPARPPPWQPVVHRLPGGGVVLLSLILGLFSRRSRPWSLAGLLLLLAGPEPWASGAALGLPVRRFAGPVAWVLRHVPLLDTLGNPGRITGLAVLAGGVAAGRLATGRRWLLPLLAPLALAELSLHRPGLALPATAARTPPAVLAALRGPTVVFPSGDPPVWNPDVAPKEVLFIAGRAGVPVAYDYGRLRTPADLPVQARLAGISGCPIGVVARRTAPPLPDSATAWGALPFDSLLVLEDRLDHAELVRLRRWLDAHARLRVRGGGWSAWDWPDRFTDAEPPPPEPATPPGARRAPGGD